MVSNAAPPSASGPPGASDDRQWYIVGRWLEFEGESRANVLRLIFIAAFYLIELINYHGLNLGFIEMPQVVDAGFHRTVTALAVGWTVVSLIVLYCMSHHFFPGSLKFISTALDVFFLTFVLANQIVSVTAFFVLKPIYTLLSLMVIVVLWKSTSLELVALKWGMLFFFVGENLCAVNVLGFQETSYLLEYGHSIGMVICLGFVTYAMLEGIDQRILGFSDPAHRCGAIGLCGRCMKNADVPCGLRRLFMMLIVLCLMLALMLPTADWHDQAYNTLVFGQFYHYGHLRVFQWLETRCCGGASIMLFAISLVIVLWGRDKSCQWTKITFSAGLGALGFGLLRTVIGGLYDQSRVWYGFWEEATELLLLSGICFVLWTFRSQLLPAWDCRVRRWGEQLVGILRAD